MMAWVRGCSIIIIIIDSLVHVYSYYYDVLFLILSNMHVASYSGLFSASFSLNTGEDQP